MGWSFCMIQNDFYLFLISNNFSIGKVREGLGKDRGDGQETGDSESSAQAAISSISFFGESFSSIFCFGRILAQISSLPFLGREDAALFGKRGYNLLKQGFAPTDHRQPREGGGGRGKVRGGYHHQHHHHHIILLFSFKKLISIHHIAISLFAFKS